GQARMLRTQGLVTGCPEHRTGVVDGISDRRELQRYARGGARLGIPDPLAGGIGTRGGPSAAATAAHRHGEGTQHARHAAGTPGADEQRREPRLCVLVLGGGLIGGALCDALLACGHRVLLATRGGRARTGVEALALDFNALPGKPALADALAGVDVLVNTVGIFRQTAQQGFDAVHVKGPRRIFEAACAAGVRRIVQLSALGADSTSPLPYFASKGRAEALLRALPVEQALVRPSLVFSPDGASTRWFAQLASLPLLPLPDGGAQPVQPVHLDDLVDALVRLVEAPQIPPALDVVGPRALSLREYLGLFRRAMGSKGWTFAIPGRVARVVAGAAALSPRLPLDRDALAMLDAGSTADAGPFARWLGRELRPLETFLSPTVAGTMRWQ